MQIKKKHWITVTNCVVDVRFMFYNVVVHNLCYFTVVYMQSRNVNCIMYIYNNCHSQIHITLINSNQKETVTSTRSELYYESACTMAC